MNRMERLAATSRELKIHTVGPEHRMARHCRQDHQGGDDAWSVVRLREELAKVNRRLADAQECRNRIERTMDAPVSSRNSATMSSTPCTWSGCCTWAWRLAREDECRVRRPDRDYLLAIRNGRLPLEEIRKRGGKTVRPTR